jgi:predicted dehydrogenase
MPNIFPRIGVIGVGQIGKHHLDNYKKIGKAHIVAVADVNESELQRVATAYGVAHAYTDFRELLKRDDIDAVDVCLHNNFHAPVSIAALRAGKHVYCEKPMAGAYVDAVAMAEVARETGRMLTIQLATLFAIETRAAKRLIDDGQLGALYHARSVGFRRRGRPYVDGYGSLSFVQKSVAAGGALYDMGVYHIARVMYLLGLPMVERISGRVYQETEMDAGRRASSHFDVEELGLGFVKCTGGATIDIFESWAAHMGDMGGSMVFGARGGIRLQPFSFFNNTGDMTMNATFDLDGSDWRWHQLNPVQDAYDDPQSHWIAALQGRVPLLPAMEAALETMLISEGIYLSDRLGREVSRDDVLAQSVSTALQVT